MSQNSLSLNKRALGIVIIAVVGILIGIFSLQNQPAPMPSSVSQQSGYKNVTAGELSGMLSDKDFFLINVHVPYEGELAKTDAFVAYDQLDMNLNMLPTDKASKIVLYCRTGRMSEIAANTLAQLGYTNLYNLSGGMVDWEKQGLPLIRKER